MSYLRGDERTGQSGVFDREELEQVPGERGYRGFGGSGNFPSSLTVNWGCSSRLDFWTHSVLLLPLLHQLVHFFDSFTG